MKPGDLPMLVVRALRPGEEPPWDLLLLADPSRQRVQDYLSRGRCYVAGLGDALIGEFVLLRIGQEGAAGRETWELMSLAVTESRQGQGWGRRLLMAAIAEARRLGAAVLELGTGNSSLSQLALYQKCGFRIVGVLRDHFARPPYDGTIVENGIRCLDMIRLALVLD